MKTGLYFERETPKIKIIIWGKSIGKEPFLKRIETCELELPENCVHLYAEIVGVEEKKPQV